MQTQVLKFSNNTGWLTAIVNGHWVQAQIGVNGIFETCVEKLAISKTENRDQFEDFFPQMCFHYCNKIEFSSVSEDFVKSIVDKIVEIKFH